MALSALGQLRDQKAEVVPVLMKALEDEILQGSAAYALGRLRPNDPKVNAALIRVRDREIKVQKGSRRRKLEEGIDAETRMMAAWALKQLPR